MYTNIQVQKPQVPVGQSHCIWYRSVKHFRGFHYGICFILTSRRLEFWAGKKLVCHCIYQGSSSLPSVLTDYSVAPHKPSSKMKNCVLRNTITTTFFHVCTNSSSKPSHPRFWAAAPIGQDAHLISDFRLKSNLPSHEAYISFLSI